MLTPEALSLEQQVAQLFMLGYGGHSPNAVTGRFLNAGLGGVIFFRDNFQGKTSPDAARQSVAAVSKAIPEDCPPLLLGIDQEGGQVERLPHTVFPTALTPRAVAVSECPAELARDMYGLMASHLAALGFNLDFFPTLDVNLNPENPIIGVRSFADEPDTVWQLAEIAQRQLADHGVIPVGKHFPGHGNGTVDSHLALPALQFSEAELTPFRQSVAAGLPAMLVAHGLYPGLQPDSEIKSGLPASASPTVIQHLLRERCGFGGVVITDDMCMGAITRHTSPVEAALLALEAGVDVLLYKQSTEAEWQVYEAVIKAFESGRLDRAQLTQSVARILRLKAAYCQPARFETFGADYRQRALAIAQRALCWQYRSERCPAWLRPDAPVLLVYPDRAQMGNYAFDIPTSPELPEVFRQAGFQNVASNPYDHKIADTAEFPAMASSPAAIVMVAFNARLFPGQVRLYESLQTCYPDAPIVVVSVGMPDDVALMPGLDGHIAACSYRPATMQALAAFLLSV